MTGVLESGFHGSGHFSGDTAVNDVLGDLIVSHTQQLFEDILIMLAQAGRRQSQLAGSLGKDKTGLGFKFLRTHGGVLQGGKIVTGG